MRRFEKRCSDYAHQFGWYVNQDPACVPQRVRVSTGDMISYDWVEGRSPVPHNFEGLVRQTAQKYLWGEGAAPPTPSDVANYAQYCSSRPGLTESLRDELFEVLLGVCHLTGAIAVHGDLTLENCVLVDDSRIVFIDPGHSRGLLCKELDEAKVLQSLDGWKSDRTEGAPGWARVEHWALLASHYARAAAHPELHSRYWTNFAMRRAESLCREILRGSLT